MLELTERYIAPTHSHTPSRSGRAHHYEAQEVSGGVVLRDGRGSELGVFESVRKARLVALERFLGSERTHGGYLFD